MKLQTKYIAAIVLGIVTFGGSIVCSKVLIEKQEENLVATLNGQGLAVTPISSKGSFLNKSNHYAISGREIGYSHKIIYKSKIKGSYFSLLHPWHVIDTVGTFETEFGTIDLHGNYGLIGNPSFHASSESLGFGHMKFADGIQFDIEDNILEIKIHKLLEPSTQRVLTKNLYLKFGLVGDFDISESAHTFVNVSLDELKVNIPKFNTDEYQPIGHFNPSFQDKSPPLDVKNASLTIDVDHHKSKKTSISANLNAQKIQLGDLESSKINNKLQIDFIMPKTMNIQSLKALDLEELINILNPKIELIIEKNFIAKIQNELSGSAHQLQPLLTQLNVICENQQNKSCNIAFNVLGNGDIQIGDEQFKSDQLLLGIAFRNELLQFEKSIKHDHFENYNICLEKLTQRNLSTAAFLHTTTVGEIISQSDTKWLTALFDYIGNDKDIFKKMNAFEYIKKDASPQTNIEKIDLLLSHGIDSSQSVLTFLSMGMVEEAQYMIEKGADFNSSTLLTSIYCQRALHSKQIPFVQFCTRYGYSYDWGKSNLNLQVLIGNNSHANDELIKSLVDKNTNQSFKNLILNKAIQGKNTVIAHHALLMGAEVASLTKSSDLSILKTVLYQNDDALFDLLIEFGALDTEDMPDSLLETSLFTRRYHVAEVLLDHDVKFNLADKYYIIMDDIDSKLLARLTMQQDLSVPSKIEKLIRWAKRNNHKIILERLQQRGVDIDV